MIIRTVFYFTLTLIYVCLDAKNVLANDISVKKTLPILSVPGVQWSPAEILYLRELNQRGSIEVATKISSSVYLPLPNGSVHGFHYQVLADFARLVDIEIIVRLVMWSDYFYTQGGDIERLKTDKNYSFTPDLIQKVDLYLDGITVMPWREKMFDILPFVPSRQLLVTQKFKAIKKLDDLDGATCVTVGATSLEQTLNKLGKQYNLKFDCIHVFSFDAIESFVASGKVDFAVLDSDRAFAAITRIKNLTISFPVSEPEMLGWAIDKNKKPLHDVLAKYIRYAHDNGVLDKYWKESYGVTFSEYMRVLNLGEVEHEIKK